MSNNRFLITLKPSSDLPEDYVTNSLYYSILDPSPDYDQLCTDLAAVYNSFPHFGDVANINVRAYDMGDETPREVLGEADLVKSSPTGAGPREVALCLSFYSERNLPRRRGRIYLGPIKAATSNAAQPSGTVLTDVLDFGDALVGIGGADVSWQTHSVATGSFLDVTNTWCDNAWDTQRRRGLKATTRQSRGV